MNGLLRSTALKIAAVVSFVLNSLSVIFSLMMIPAGASAINNDPEAIPYVVVLIGLVTGVIGVIAAYGAWKQQRWGVVLTILTSLVNGLSAAPGILFAPSTGLFFAALMTVIGSVVIVVLCLWPGRRVVTA